MPLNPALGRLKQEDSKSEVSLLRPYLKKENLTKAGHSGL
jgi:hypothetical protein